MAVVAAAVVQVALLGSMRRGVGAGATYLLVISLTWHTTIASTLSLRPAGELTA